VGYVWCEIRQQSSEEPCDETSFGKKKITFSLTFGDQFGLTPIWVSRSCDQFGDEFGLTFGNQFGLAFGDQFGLQFLFSHLCDQFGFTFGGQFGLFCSLQWLIPDET